MTREIISVSFGQCGNQIVQKFWENVINEHEINYNGKYFGKETNDLCNIDVYFHETSSGRYVPRNVTMDLDSRSIDDIKSSPIGRLYNPSNFVAGVRSAGNNFAKGHFTEGPEYIEELMDTVRRETELSNCIQGFQINHSLGGGTGSGTTTLFQQKLREEFPDRMIASFSIIPALTMSDVVVEPINTILSLYQLVDYADQVFCMDNQALAKICIQTLKMDHPTFKDLNHLISITMAGVTCSLRYPGQLNGDLRKMATNLVPFPRIHFFMTGFAPLISRDVQLYKENTVAELTRQMFNISNMMVGCDPRLGKYLTVATMFRGNLSMKQVDEHVYKIQNRNSGYFVEWIPNNIKTSVCNVAPKGMKMSTTFVANNTAIQQIYKKVADTFQLMYRRKAFLHWYTNEGMELEEFEFAKNNIDEMINELQQFQEATAEDEANDKIS